MKKLIKIKNRKNSVALIPFNEQTFHPLIGGKTKKYNLKLFFYVL